jgi:hypothetical protein
VNNKDKNGVGWKARRRAIVNSPLEKGARGLCFSRRFYNPRTPFVKGELKGDFLKLKARAQCHCSGAIPNQVEDKFIAHFVADDC